MRITILILVIFGFFLLMLVPAFLIDYFPWEGGYKQGTAEYSGHGSARFMHSAKECAIDSDMGKNEGFQRGCRAFFEP